MPSRPSMKVLETRKAPRGSQSVGEVVIAHLAARRDDEAAIVERPAGLQVDGRAERAFVDFRRRALAHGQPAEQLGGEDVEIEGAAAIGAARAVGAAGRRQRLELVEADAGEIGAEAAHRDRAALAGVAVDRDARDALQRFGEVLVGEVGDILGDDHVDDAVVLRLAPSAAVSESRKPVTTTSLSSPSGGRRPGPRPAAARPGRCASAWAALAAAGEGEPRGGAEQAGQDASARRDVELRNHVRSFQHGAHRRAPPFQSEALRAPSCDTGV